MRIWCCFAVVDSCCLLQWICSRDVWRLSCFVAHITVDSRTFLRSLCCCLCCTVVTLTLTILTTLANIFLRDSVRNVHQMLNCARECRKDDCGICRFFVTDCFPCLYKWFNIRYMGTLKFPPVFSTPAFTVNPIHALERLASEMTSCVSRVTVQYHSRAHYLLPPPLLVGVLLLPPFVCLSLC